MTANELRQKYLDFFQSRGHVVIPSAPLVPADDPTTLFTSSGMQPLIPYLLGAEHPSGKKLVNSQKSFRTEDIEEVGDNRHTTFFEMLGNWSLGDYFKREQLSWFFEFLTDIVELDPRKLYVTVFAGDDANGVSRDTESAKIWQELFAQKNIESKLIELGTEERGAAVGMQGGRIFYYGAKKNWWSRSGLPQNMPVGEPGGPDSEVFYEFSSVGHDAKFGEWCHPNCDCGRYMEIGNSVFMEYHKMADGKFEKLPQQNVDFGGGLERMVAASNDDPDIFRIDVFASAVRELAALSGKKYDPADAQAVQSFRILADHLRAAVFLIADGVTPSNKDRGYIVRRLLRRSMVYARKLGVAPDWFERVYDAIQREMQGAYPELLIQRGKVLNGIWAEFQKFTKTLDKGLKEFEKISVVNGKIAFDLYQTYGFPWELTRELAEVKGQNVDKAEFETEFKKHQDLSRTSSAGVFKGGLADHTQEVIRLHTATHLMNQALRAVLGEHVWQKGSHITRERTRFDFTHPEKITPEQIIQVEELVNGWIRRNLQVKKEIMPLEDARKLNAIGAFGEKYGKTVSVYTVHDPKSDEIISREFCGGPHVEHTGVIGKFKIAKEEAIAAGIRRIRAVIH